MNTAILHHQPSIESILAPLRVRQAKTNETITLSDFDYTLCHSYGFDPATNNHLPQIDPIVISAAKNHNLLVATGRRANTTAISLLWDSGLVALDMPIIAENGGTIVERHTNGDLSFNDLVAPENIVALTELQSLIRTMLPALPDSQQLIFKQGRTMLLARLQDQHGTIDPHHQAWLTRQLKKIIPADDLNIINTRVSVSIQHRSISKGAAFEYYLNLKGLLRKDVFVIGMGDGENDKELFAQSDISIGFSDAVKHMVDIEVPRGSGSTSRVLNAISTAISNKVAA